MIDTDTTHDKESSPYRVLGIALIVDQRGKEARMVLRYPAAPSSSTTRSSAHHGNDDDQDQDNVFFRLQSRGMAKLFRPKQPLCGQPMTLSVGGTVFCCRALLMPEDSSSAKINKKLSAESTGASSASEAANDEPSSSSLKTPTSPTSPQQQQQQGQNGLVLFSLVVALVPRKKSESLPITGWFEGGTSSIPDEPELSLHRSNIEAEPSKDKNDKHSTNASASFLAVRKVHVSLARLSRVLEREELRCKYVSLQSNLFQAVQQKLQTEAEQQRRTSPSRQQQTQTHHNAQPPPPPQQQTHATTQSQQQSVVSSSQQPQTTNSASSSPVSVSAKGAIGTTVNKTHSHRRANSYLSLNSDSASSRPVPPGSNTGIVGNTSSSNNNNKSSKDSTTMVEVNEQQVLEAMATATPPVYVETGIRHEGNLARELMEVFHALSRNDDIPPTSLDILTARSCIVYVNQHVAVTIESVAALSIPDRVYPFHTILFPKVTPAQLRESMCTTSTAPRRLHQLLLALNPRKALYELDTNLPLSVVMELAEYLVAQGVARSFPVLSGDARLACASLSRIDDLLLSFQQSFNVDVPLFVLVSFLTGNGRTLGECFALVKENKNDRIANLIRSRLMPKPQVHIHQNELFFIPPKDGGVGASDAAQEQEILDDTLVQMTVWLLTRDVLVQLQEYLVGTHGRTSGPSCDENLKSDDVIGEKAKADYNTATSKSFVASDAFIYRQLKEADCLSGRTSLPTCAWRLSLDINVLRDWARRHSQIRIITRSPVASDDQPRQEFENHVIREL